jgi:hypothetical protein
MAVKSQVVGQIAIPLPPQMLRRSLAWQARRDQRAEYRAAFDETRVHGLRVRHVMKQIRLDTDESLRELGLMPARAASAPAAPPADRPPAETRPPTRTAATPTPRPLVDRAVVDRAVVDRPAPPAAVAEPAIPNPSSLRATPPQLSDTSQAAPEGTTSTRPSPTESARLCSTTTVAAGCAGSGRAGPSVSGRAASVAAGCAGSGGAGPSVSGRAASVVARCAGSGGPAPPASGPALTVAPSPMVGGTASRRTSSGLCVAVFVAASGACACGS